MKAPSDLRTVVSLLLVMAGIGAICFVLYAPISGWVTPPWVAWCLLIVGLPLIGAGLLHPFRRTALGVVLGVLADFMIYAIGIIMFAISGPIC